MSRRLNSQARRLGQSGATKESAREKALTMFPRRGMRTVDKMARLISRFLEGRKKAA
jgi:hypothetical protein